MDLKKKIGPLFLLLLLISCAKEKDHSGENAVFLSRQIQTGLPEAYKQYGPISALRRHQLILDTDGDGLIDKNDPDIDGDGVLNDCDSAPFEPSAGILDSDHDGIPTFCDLNPYSDRIPENKKSLFQKKIFAEYGIILFEDDLKFDEKDIPFLSQLIKDLAARTSLPNPKLSTILSTSKFSSKEDGSYDEAWGSIRYNYDATPLPLSLNKWQWTLTHELFHFLAAAEPALFNSFYERYRADKERGTLLYPTEYAKTDAAEFFAEAEALRYFTESDSRDFKFNW